MKRNFIDVDKDSFNDDLIQEKEIEEEKDAARISNMLQEFASDREREGLVFVLLLRVKQIMMMVCSREGDNNQ